MTMNINKGHYFEDGHANDHALALLADSLVTDEKEYEAADPGAAPPKEIPGEVLDHVDQCSLCKDKILDVVMFMRNPEAVPAQIQPKQATPEKEHFPLSMPQRDRTFYTGKIAAVFAACAVMIGAYFLVFNNSSEIQKLQPTARSTAPEIQPIPAVQPDSSQTTTASKPKKAAPPSTKKNTAPRVTRFDVNPTLENMIGSRLRSGTFEAVTPPDNSIVAGIIHFSWKKKLEKIHTLKIVNNRNTVLFTYQIDGSAMDIEEDLEPGLYYWKVENDNELLYVGKFRKQ